MAAVGCKVAAAFGEDDDSGDGCTLPSVRSGVRGGADPVAARQQRRRAEAGGDQALYNGFGAAGMHGAAVMQPPTFGQIQGLELRLRSFYEVENFSSPPIKRDDSLARD
ncbi:hypothetical protein OsJ_32129 [Oryza sativa Japonica Group]|uniref:Uncharacterized protein n=3 Tax=Oryza TaxID=4527 RepID=A0A8J8Y8F4_ORYSJ|nr:hypothetical protein LOC_Os10g36729 [Oryza sativa Japonica Group]EAZ16656.1 hypothetical protein OsJ_32129 [Oryza sativa Japonica Group]